MFEARKAQRENVNLLIGLDGPSGSGKTLGALKIAYGICGNWERIAFADTENNSALYYAGETTGDWLHIPFDVGVKDSYHPNNFVKLIEYAESLPIDVLIIDSISHEWVGQGGCLDTVNKIGGNSYIAWKEVTPAHDKFIDKMRHSSKHIIATMRSKTEYVVEANSKGKMAPKKVGMSSVQRDGVDYEFGVIYSIDLNHMAKVEKDRTNLFKDRPPFIIDESVGKELIEWAKGGVEPHYVGTRDQKKQLMKMATELNKDVSSDYLKYLHDKCQGEPMSEIKTIIERELCGG